MFIRIYTCFRLEIFLVLFKCFQDSFWNYWGWGRDTSCLRTLLLRCLLFFLSNLCFSTCVLHFFCLNCLGTIWCNCYCWTAFLVFQKHTSDLNRQRWCSFLRDDIFSMLSCWEMWCLVLCLSWGHRISPRIVGFFLCQIAMFVVLFLFF